MTHHRGADGRVQLLDHAHHGVQRALERRIGRDQLQHAALAVSERVGLPARGNVDDARAYQPALRRRQPDEPDLARHVVALGVPVQPFEHGPAAVQRAIDVAPREAERRRAIGLQLGADGARTDLEQLLARELEEVGRVLVRVDEALLIDVEHHDRLRRVLDERTVACFAFAQRLLVLQPLGDVAQADHEAVVGPARRAAHHNLGLE